MNMFFYLQDLSAFTAPQVETSGSTKSDAQTVRLIVFWVVAFNFLAGCFLKLAFLSRHMIYEGSLDVFAWL